MAQIRRRLPPDPVLAEQRRQIKEKAKQYVMHQQNAKSIFTQHKSEEQKMQQQYGGTSAAS